MRCADDLVLDFEYGSDARRSQAALRQRRAKFGLELHAEETQLIEFGRKETDRRRLLGQGKLEVFGSLEFTHICGRMKNGPFEVIRRTRKRQGARTLKEIRGALIERRHLAVPEQGAGLNRVLRGYFS